MRRGRYRGCRFRMAPGAGIAPAPPRVRSGRSAPVRCLLRLLSTIGCGVAGSAGARPAWRLSKRRIFRPGCASRLRAISPSDRRPDVAGSAGPPGRAWHVPPGPAVCRPPRTRIRSARPRRRQSGSGNFHADHKVSRSVVECRDAPNGQRCPSKTERPQHREVSKVFWFFFPKKNPSYFPTKSRIPSLLPLTPILYIKSAVAGGNVKLPSVAARIRLRKFTVPADKI